MRIKRGTQKNRRHKKYLKHAKGYRGSQAGRTGPHDDRAGRRRRVAVGRGRRIRFRRLIIHGTPISAWSLSVRGLDACCRRGA